MMLLQKGYSENQHPAHSNLLLTTQPQCKQQQQQQDHYDQTLLHMPYSHNCYNDSQVMIDTNVQQYKQQQQHQDDSILTQLSREQLIERVVQLEMERSNRSAADADCRVFYEQARIGMYLEIDDYFCIVTNTLGIRHQKESFIIPNYTPSQD